jgi:hypothetical protein
MHTEFLWRNLKERDYLEGVGINGRIILKWISKKWDRRAWAGFIWLGIKTSGGLIIKITNKMHCID